MSRLCASTEEARAYHQHLMGCRSCFAPSGNHCQSGLELKLDADARFICDLASLDDRRRWMRRFRLEIPAHIERLEARVQEKYASMKERRLGQGS